MLADGSTSSNWHKIVDTSVSEENAPAIAVFDVRCVPFNSPIYHKSLTIHFAPGFDPESILASPDGQTLEDRIKIVDCTVTALSLAFQHLVTEAENTRDRLVKIYCEHEYRQMIFTAFAKNLMDGSPDLYKASFHGKWVEIQHLKK